LPQLLRRKKNAKKRKKTKDEEISSGEEKKKSDDYRTCTGVLHSQPRALDVKIGGFSLAAYGRELIKDTTLELTIGRRYGLIGQNGSGKSTMLKCLAAREVPIPDHIDIFLLEEEASKTDMTALEMILSDARKKVAELEAEAERLIEEDGPDSDVVQDIYARLEDLDEKTFEVRAGTLLHGLGFTKEMSLKKTKDMSGGWRMRVSLAKALFIKPSLLLLDEPTNHLDLEACVWLEQYLSKYPRCLIVVSHSQDFLNSVCSHIIHITPNKRTLQEYSGNYDTFIKTKKELEVNQMKKYKKEQEDIKHLKAFISSCGTYANLVRQAKSKQKILDKMYAAGLTEAVVDPPKYTFRFQQCEVLTPPVLAFQNVAFAYSGKKEDYLYTNVSLGVDLDSRVALVGPNGAGKSTLLKLMCGDLNPTEGAIRRHIHLEMGRFHQHSIDILNPEKTVLQFFMDTFPEKKMEEQSWRQHIGKYGVSGPTQLTYISSLSDGLKSRIVFAMIALSHPHLLLLDEPTNHLDIECIDSLAEALNKFNGGLVLVSHDFRLISQVAKEIWVCDNHSVKKWSGDIRSYKDSLIKGMRQSKLLD